MATNKVTLLLYCLLIGICPLAGQGYDRTWITGMHEYPDTPGYNNVTLKFSPGSIDIQEVDLRMNFESTVGAISDSSGNLLFYTNGCHIANASGDTMPGSDGLNPGEMHDWTCGKTGYVCPRGVLILPLPDNPNVYYLFHMGARYDAIRKLTYGPLYYTVVDMQLDGGRGAVVTKNNLVTDGDLEPFTAVRHGNGRDWWIVTPEYATNIYRLFLLGPGGLQGPYTQSIGSVMPCRRIGSSTFSLRGDKFARAQNCQAIVFDFDRCAGTFYNPLLLDLPDNSVGGGGVAFSPNSERLLVATQLQIYQADLTLAAPKLDSAFEWNYYQWGVRLQYMQYTPDGQILLNHMHRTNYFSVLENPEASGEGLHFVPKGLPLPVYSARTLPNYPNYRLYDLPGSACDTLGIDGPTATSEPQHIRNQTWVQLSPNPASDHVEIASGQAPIPPVRIRCYTTAGHLVLDQSHPAHLRLYRLDVSALTSGCYLMEIILGDQSRIWKKCSVMH